MQSTQSLRTHNESATHDHRTAKVVELVSLSTTGFQEAIENALEDARQTTRGITGAHVEGLSVQCEDGRIVAYKVNLKLAFGIERTAGLEGTESSGAPGTTGTSNTGAGSGSAGGGGAPRGERPRGNR